MRFRDLVATSIADMAVNATGQAVNDRLGSKINADKLTALVAGSGFLAGVGLKLLGDYGHQDWAEVVGDGFVLGGLGMGAQMGMGLLDPMMGIKDPPLAQSLSPDGQRQFAVSAAEQAGVPPEAVGLPQPSEGSASGSPAALSAGGSAQDASTHAEQISSDY